MEEGEERRPRWRRRPTDRQVLKEQDAKENEKMVRERGGPGPFACGAHGATRHGAAYQHRLFVYLNYLLNKTEGRRSTRRRRARRKKRHEKKRKRKISPAVGLLVLGRQEEHGQPPLTDLPLFSNIPRPCLWALPLQPRPDQHRSSSSNSSSSSRRSLYFSFFGF